MPVQEPIATTGFNGVTGSKGAHAKGVELNLVARPVADLSFSASGAYVSATCAGALPGTGIVDGAHVDNVAKFTANASAD